jgi:very-short-patch-repair endonuclease
LREGAKLRLARALRRELTAAERKLWYRLRRKQLEGFRFRRQVPCGPYIADFLCVGARLVVEVDGSQHGEATADVQRDAWFRAQGYRVLRYWNNDVMERTEEVLAAIMAVLSAPHPAFGHLPPQAGEGKSRD